MVPIKKYTEPMLSAPLFQWMLKEGLENFEDCFDLELEEDPQISGTSGAGQFIKPSPVGIVYMGDVYEMEKI